MLHGPVARAGSCGNASTLPLLHPCLSPSYTCVSPPLSLARNATLVHAVSLACAQLAAGLAPGCLGSKSPRWSYNYVFPSSSRRRPSGNAKYFFWLVFVFPQFFLVCFCRCGGKKEKQDKTKFANIVIASSALPACMCVYVWVRFCTWAHQCVRVRVHMRREIIIDLPFGFFPINNIISLEGWATWVPQ